MMGIETIIAENKKRARLARILGKEPYVIMSQQQIDNMPPFPFPHIGHYNPKGWKKMNTYFVDSSGFGREGEAALTVREFISRLKIGRGYAITEAGQFQCQVSEFIRR